MACVDGIVESLEGHWRPSMDTDLILPCLDEKLCGYNNVCANGNTGLLCMQC